MTIQRFARKVVVYALVLAHAGALTSATAQKLEDAVVYVTLTGKKYHAKGCRTLHRSKTITEIKQSEAVRQGYGPCKVCH